MKFNFLQVLPVSFIAFLFMSCSESTNPTDNSGDVPNFITLTIKVIDSQTSQPISNADVNIETKDISAQMVVFQQKTGSDGIVSFGNINTKFMCQFSGWRCAGTTCDYWAQDQNIITISPSNYYNKTYIYKMTK